MVWMDGSIFLLTASCHQPHPEVRPHALAWSLISNYREGKIPKNVPITSMSPSEQCLPRGSRTLIHCMDSHNATNDCMHTATHPHPYPRPVLRSQESSRPLVFLIRDLAHLAQPVPRCIERILELQNFDLSCRQTQSVSNPSLYPWTCPELH